MPAVPVLVAFLVLASYPQLSAKPGHAADPIPDAAKQKDGDWTPWMLDDGGPNDYHLHWREMVELGYYSHSVEGRMSHGIEEYRAIFRPVLIRPHFWYSYHGLDRAMFAKEHASVTKLGFECTCYQEFTTDTGEVRIQATWVKSREAFKRDPRYLDPDGNIKQIDWKKYPQPVQVP